LDLHDEILTALRRVIRATDRHSRQLMQSSGLTGPQLVVLRRLALHGEHTVGDLARTVSLGQPTVTGIVMRLERRGLVARHRSRFDRRRVMVGPTAEGCRVVEEAPPLLQERFLQQLSRLEDWEQSLILSSLQRVVRMMEAERIEASPILVTGPIDSEPRDESVTVERSDSDEEVAT
jgi:DNA-binding MarR family transcriptional regulator